MRASGVVAITLLAFAAACGDEATAPAAGDDELDLTVMADSAGGREYHMPVLMRRAYQQVAAQQGSDAARALVAPVRALHDEARAALRAGDRTTARAKADAARELQIRIVLDVLGHGIAASAVAALETDLARLQERIATAQAEGRDVTRPERAAARIASLHATAAAALAAGDPEGTLRAASEAGHVFTRLHRQRHHRPGSGGHMQARANAPRR